ncbi:LuxR C-terminal-related transcriptional regulator [Halalkalibacterium ligniniphilum]|uniref:LuxR C-terminal-related transcriptional regulator n=1 Tax=Halalkalibacterium ligniniphilum TaxID=1134413 RepID=UPI000378608D|nr:LuxR C-terminal-related transcriptional regulator [Halalkalibacterium ligniniphilum]
MHELMDAIKIIRHGGLFFHHQVMKYLIDELRFPFTNDDVASSSLVNPHDVFSKREYQVLKCMADGLRNEGIGHRLNISILTVKKSCLKYLTQNGVNSRLGSVAKAIKYDWVLIENEKKKPSHPCTSVFKKLCQSYVVSIQYVFWFWVGTATDWIIAYKRRITERKLIPSINIK